VDSVLSSDGEDKSVDDVSWMETEMDGEGEAMLAKAEGILMTRQWGYGGTSRRKVEGEVEKPLEMTEVASRSTKSIRIRKKDRGRKKGT
jgi:hypothetical protein